MRTGCHQPSRTRCPSPQPQTSVRNSLVLLPLGVLHSCPKHRGIQTPTAPSWKGTAQASACAGAHQDNFEHGKPNNLVPAPFPLEKGCHTQTGKQGKRLNPHTLRCRYTNHDSSHMLADNGAPGPAPRSPEQDSRCSGLTLGELRATGGQGPRAPQDRGKTGEELLGPVDMQPGPRPAPANAQPTPGDSTGDKRPWVAVPGSRGEDLGDASIAARGGPVLRWRGWAHTPSGGDFLW